MGLKQPLSLEERETIRAAMDGPETLPAPNLEPIPATQRALTGSAVSGLRASFKPTGAGDEAYAEMQRAVDRGACKILTSVIGADNLHHVWSAWLIEDHQLLCQEWHKSRTSEWERGASFVMDEHAIRGLLDLLTTPRQA